MFNSDFVGEKMAARRNGVYIIQGEMSLVVSALRRNARWGSHSHQVNMKQNLMLQ